MDRDEIIKMASQAIDDTRSALSLPIPFVMRFAALIAAAERAKLEKQKPVAYLTADKNMLVFADKCVDMQHLMTPLYAAPPVTAQAEGYVTALSYIAWTAAGYMECVHAAKQAIGETGALPPPPNTQPTRSE